MVAKNELSCSLVVTGMTRLLSSKKLPSLMAKSSTHETTLSPYRPANLHSWKLPLATLPWHYRLTNLHSLKTSIRDTTRAPYRSRICTRENFHSRNYPGMLSTRKSSLAKTSTRETTPANYRLANLHSLKLPLMTLPRHHYRPKNLHSEKLIWTIELRK